MSSAAEVKRGEGSTTKQMLSAPKQAFFVCPGEYTNYFRDLAKTIDRKDLVIYPASILNDANYSRLGGVENAIIVDHALVLNANASRNLNMLTYPGRKITQAVEEPELVSELLHADVISWSPQGTGLIIRGADFKVKARLKYQPPSIDGNLQQHREAAMKLMEQCAALISLKGSVEEGLARPSQDKTLEMDRDTALKVIVGILTDQAAPAIYRKKIADALAAVI